MSEELDKALSAKSDQLCADDLYGDDRTIKITSVKIFLNQPQPIHIGFEGDDGKPWKPSKTQGRIMKAIWGRDENKWIGKRVTIYREPTVKWSGQEVGGIFISHIEGIDKPTKLVLAESKHKKSPIIVKPLDDEIYIPDEPDMPTIDPDAALQSAKDAAKKGKLEFSSWWKENPPLRDSVKPYMDELKSLVEDADNPDIDPDEVPL